MNRRVVRWLPVLASLAAAITAGAVCWSLAREDAERWSEVGWGIGPELRFVLVFAAIAGALAYFATRRALCGPALERTEWVLTVPPLTPKATGYRSVESMTVGDLLQRLRGLGYRPSVQAVDDFGEVSGPLDESHRLAGARFALVDDRFKRGRAVVAVSPVVDGASGLAYLDALDRSGGPYQELCSFLIVELARMLPGLKYKLADSSLDPDEADLLRASLPQRPTQLPR